jgi:hypothetical protein
MRYRWMLTASHLKGIHRPRQAHGYWNSRRPRRPRLSDNGPTQSDDWPASHLLGQQARQLFGSKRAANFIDLPGKQNCRGIQGLNPWTFGVYPLKLRNPFVEGGKF